MEVARQFADLLVGNDDLATVIAAVEEGRRVDANIRRFLLYALSGGLRDPADAGRPAPGALLPLLPAQILWLSPLTHFFAGAAPGTEPIEIETMTTPASGPVGGCPGRWTLMAHSSGHRRACRGQPQREPGRREPARVLRRAALPRSGTVGGSWGWSGGPHHTKMPAVSRVSEPMTLAPVEAAYGLPLQ